MISANFILRQILDVKLGGYDVLGRKLFKLGRGFFKIPFYFIAIFSVLIIRTIRPWLLVRVGSLVSSRIGHFAANTELFLCERDAGINVPHQHHINIFQFQYKPICNQQLAVMWKKLFNIWPTWILSPIIQINRLIPGGLLHEITQNTQHDRDVHNLLSQIPQHLKFTLEEEVKGSAGLQSLGIPKDGLFVCLTVRDSSYLAAHLIGSDFSYHNYRDANVQNYVLAAEELVNRGYYVIRMGAKVLTAINSNNPKIIDYATNGMRTDFMDIYLGAKCEFCVTQGSGFDAIPAVFRRPILQVNAVPLGYCYTWGPNAVFMTKHHIDNVSGCELSMREIFSRGVGFSLHTSDFESKGVCLIENSAEEIRDAVIEMSDRLAGVWKETSDDDFLQTSFWKVFPINAVDPEKDKPLHGQIHSRFSAAYLRARPWWVE